MTKAQAKRTPLERLLASIYNQFQHLDPPEVNTECRRDFVFHMTDWLGDLLKLEKLYATPDKFSDEEAILLGNTARLARQPRPLTSPSQRLQQSSPLRCADPFQHRDAAPCCGMVS